MLHSARLGISFFKLISTKCYSTRIDELCMLHDYSLRIDEKLERRSYVSFGKELIMNCLYIAEIKLLMKPTFLE